MAVIRDAVVAKNDQALWDRFLHFSTRYLRAPPRGGKQRSLCTLINKQLREEADTPTASEISAKPCSRGGKSHHQDPITYLASKVSSKLEEGDFTDAVRLTCSEDVLADMNEATYCALQQNHPSPHPGSSIPPQPSQPSVMLAVSAVEIAEAITSFPNGSAGGPDGLRPQHLKDLINTGSGSG